MSKFICSQNMFETNVNNLYTHNKFPSESLESEIETLLVSQSETKGDFYWSVCKGVAFHYYPNKGACHKCEMSQRTAYWTICISNSH